MTGSISDEDRARADEVREELRQKGLGDEIQPRGENTQASSGDLVEGSGWSGRRTPRRNADQN